MKARIEKMILNSKFPISDNYNEDLSVFLKYYLEYYRFPSKGESFYWFFKWFCKELRSPRGSAHPHHPLHGKLLKIDWFSNTFNRNTIINFVSIPLRCIRWRLIGFYWQRRSSVELFGDTDIPAYYLAGYIFIRSPRIEKYQK